MGNTLTNVTTGGSSFATVLFLIFLILKLTGNITWSWWWVTAPLWGGFALLLGIMALVLIILAIIAFSLWFKNVVFKKTLKNYFKHVK